MRGEEWAGRQLIPAGAWVQWPSSPPVPRSVSSISFLHSSRHVVVRACNRKQKEEERRALIASILAHFGSSRVHSELKVMVKKKRPAVLKQEVEMRMFFHPPL